MLARGGGQKVAIKWCLRTPLEVTMSKDTHNANKQQQAAAQVQRATDLTTRTGPETTSSLSEAIFEPPSSTDYH